MQETAHPAAPPPPAGRAGRAKRRRRALLLWLPAAALIGGLSWHGLALVMAVREVRAMDVLELDRAVEHSPWQRNPYFLAAVVQNPHARAGLLERIAALREPALYDSLPPVWGLTADNQDGRSVMRLLAEDPNAGTAVLGRLASGPEAKRVLPEVLANPNTPGAALARWYGSADRLAQLGLALNPKTPQRVILRLAHSANRAIRLRVARNFATPREILDWMAAGADAEVARAAKLAIAQRTAASLPSRFASAAAR